MEELAKKIKDSLGKIKCDVSIWRDRRLEVRVDVNDLLETVEILHNRQNSFRFLCTIVGLDTGEDLEVKYILGDKADILTLTVNVPYDKPRVPTLTGLIPSATLYEREVHDLLGVKFWGHPNLKPLVLSDDWPEGMYPLRKDFQFYKDDDGIPVKGCLINQSEDIKQEIERTRDDKSTQATQKKSRKKTGKI